MAGKQGGKQDVRGSGGRIFRLVIPFVVAIVAGVIVWLASSRGSVPAPEGTRIVDTGQPQLINAVLAGLAAMMMTVIIVRVVARPKPRRSR